MMDWLIKHLINSFTDNLSLERLDGDLVEFKVIRAESRYRGRYRITVERLED